MSDLSNRRAIFAYEAARLAAIAANAPIIPEPWEQRDEAFRAQMTAAVERQCNMPMSAEEAHGAWVQAYIDMGWRYGETRDTEAKTHPDMVPYAQLGQLERDKDEVFAALCNIARQWIYDVREPAVHEARIGTTADQDVICAECRRSIDDPAFDELHDVREPAGEG